MNTLRSGYTTGSCATAASKAALRMLLSGNVINAVCITLPCGEKAEFKLHDYKIVNGVARCGVQKDGGDDPDCTNGLMIYAEVKTKRHKGVIIEGGLGIGIVTKPGLHIPVGEYAINRIPRLMIKRELENVLDEYGCHRGVHVKISVPGGEKTALRTFNPKLGIVGGISIIGTTGKVKPYSVPAVKKSMILFLDQAKACGYKLPVLVPGNIGEKAAHRRYVLGNEQVVQMSNYVGFMVRQASKRFDNVIVLGHPGKLLKINLGCYNTHSQKSISPVPYIKKKASEQLWYGSVKNGMCNMPTVEGVIGCIPERKRFELFNPLASKIERRLKGYVRSALDIGVVLVDMNSSCIGLGRNARYWEGRECLQLR